jgi:hypothetical protein
LCFGLGLVNTARTWEVGGISGCLNGLIVSICSYDWDFIINIFLRLVCERFEFGIRETYLIQ